MTRSKEKPSANVFSLNDYCDKSVVPALAEDMKVDISTLRQLMKLPPSTHLIA